VLTSRAPALATLCDDLDRSSRSLDFLHEARDTNLLGSSATDSATSGAPPRGSLGGSYSNPEAALEYSLSAPLAPRNVRLSLTADEELRCFGRYSGGCDRSGSCPAQWRGAGVGWRLPRGLESDDAIDLAHGLHVCVRKVEADLLALVPQRNGSSGSTAGLRRRAQSDAAMLTTSQCREVAHRTRSSAAR
jgi:hypothetical protein